MKRILFFLTFLIALFPVFVFAASTDTLTGYAWSSTIGWISFNCTNDSSCGTSNYGVTQDSSDNLIGYAWSPNIGWIQFGGLSGFPTGGGTQAQDANVNGNNVKGWAKAIVATGGGWDGWISLNGSGYGVTLSGSSFTGYAWGSDVVGWLSFDAGGANGVVLTGPAPSFSLTGPASLSLTALGANGTQSTTGTIFVDNGGTSYNKTVTVTAAMGQALPASTTVMYSFNSGASYSSNPSIQISNYAVGFGLRVKFNKTLPASPTYSVVLTGVGTDNKTATKTILLNQTQYNPRFQEL